MNDAGRIRVCHPEVGLSLTASVVPYVAATLAGLLAFALFVHPYAVGAQTGRMYRVAILELLRAVAPKVSRVAVLLQSTNPAHPAIFVRTMTAGQKVGIPAVVTQAGTIEEIEREFAVMTKERANGVIVPGNPLFLQASRLLADQALRLRLPSISYVYVSATSD